MSLVTNLSNLATRIATEIKAVRTLVNGNAADLSGLATTAKSDLVAAVNEVKTIADGAAGGGVTINDAATNTTQTWSSSKINTSLPTWSSISGKPAVIAAGADAATARSAIGAGTSDLTIGTTGTTAAAGNDTRIVNAVPNTRTVNAKPLSGNITLTAADVGASATGHLHDDRYYTETETDTLLAGKSDTGHDHSTDDVTGLQAFVDGRVQIIVDSAPAALDTLAELAAAIGDDANFATTMTTALSNRVRVDAVQGFTSPQMLQARQNIDAASATDVGDTTTNFVTVFEAGLV